MRIKTIPDSENNIDSITCFEVGAIPGWVIGAVWDDQAVMEARCDDLDLQAWAAHDDIREVLLVVAVCVPVSEYQTAVGECLLCILNALFIILFN